MVTGQRGALSGKPTVHIDAGREGQRDASPHSSKSTALKRFTPRGQENRASRGIALLVGQVLHSAFGEQGPFGLSQSGPRATAVPCTTGK